MRSLMNFGLGCSGCVTLLGILISLTLVGLHLGARCSASRLESDPATRDMPE